MAQYFQGNFGIDQGEVTPFSDFENNGPMWVGTGTREVRTRIPFEVAFALPPIVHVSVTMWDVAAEAATRLDVGAEEIDQKGFTLRVRTWSDSRIARVRVAWLAFGACRDDEMWEVG
ncbi:H-type lectin domain-containing protein [uncultured Limimaricola sp.]|uniref:H-type lectin domain-containing protein n=1 Tax=uncultured Limimaricola sp. TaxID=2211667 RepID=UPI0030FB9724